MIDIIVQKVEVRDMSVVDYVIGFENIETWRLSRKVSE